MSRKTLFANFQGTVRRDSILESQKEAKKQMALALAKMGKLSDQNLFKILDPNFDFREKSTTVTWGSTHQNSCSCCSGCGVRVRVPDLTRNNSHHSTYCIVPSETLPNHIAFRL